MIFRIVEFTALLAILSAIGCGLGYVAATFGGWWLVIATPISLAVGIVAWAAFRQEIDRRWYR